MRYIYKCIKSISLYLLLFSITIIHSSSCKGTLQQKNEWSELHVKHILEGHNGNINIVLFSPDGNNILTFSEDSTAIIWETKSGALKNRLIGHKGVVRCACFFKGGEGVQTFADDGVIKRWNSITGQEISSIQISKFDSRIISAGFSPDGKKLAIGFQGRAVLYDTDSGQILLRLSPFGHPGLRVNTTNIEFSIDGTRIITSAYSHEVAVWNAITGTRLLNLHEHGNGCLTAIISPDMTKLASGSRDKTVIIWDARSGTIIEKINIGWEVKSVAFNPTGSTLCVVENVRKGEIARLSILDLATKSQINELQVTDKICNSSFSSKEKILVIPFHNKAIVYSSNQSDGYFEGGLQELTGDVKEITNIAIADENEAKRLIACRELRKYNNELDEVTSELSGTLKSKDINIRYNTVLALAEIGKPRKEFISILKDILINDSNPQVRTVAAFALGNFSEEIDKPIAVRELIQALKDNYVWVRYHAAHALEKMSSDSIMGRKALVETVLSDSSTGVRRQIAFNIGNAGIKSLSALPTLIDSTKSTNERTRWWACYTIWCITSATGELSKGAIPALKEAIKDTSDYRDENGGPPYKYAIHALSGIGPVVKKIDPEIVTILEHIMEDDNEYYQRKAAALALESILEVKGLRQKVRGFVKK